MPLGIAEGRNLLTSYEFKTLFIEELGWNRHKAKFVIPVDGRTFTLSAIAEKCGMVAFVCDPGTDGRIPDHPSRRKIERQIAKNAHEHLIIFTDETRTAQVWQWVRREHGKPTACREYPYRVGQPGDSLIQKIRSLAVSLEEEADLTLPDVTGRVRKAFDVERVTKKFYDRFKTEHAAFLKFLDGIPDEETERWYVSVMLNRLMFVYFIQKKGFLGGGDADYLKHKLTQCRNELGKDRYYRDFLCPLFFEGFAKTKEERSKKAGLLLGEVPYLNGGIFMPHQIEQLYGKTIAIPDKAFERLFAFFDAYRWHLDERPLKKDDEINPDVLGYIFEKYINQKQMGAYYTKEDITEYIGKNTLIPFLFDAAREKCKVAFEGERPVWGLLQEDPDRYIYKAVRHGVTWNYHPKSVDKNEGDPMPRPIPLPPAIEEGLDPTKPNLLERRKPWNKAATPEYALPTETWREVVARRKRHDEVKGKLAAGEVRFINDFITYNLDIRQFAQDAIENAEGPELLVAFWNAIEAVTVLDPTCGSGAFLFAALNILDPLYEACLERMRFFLDEWGDSGKKNHPNYYKLFTEILKRVEEHPNPRYFVLKSIIMNNLHGVDIMEEAVEICKLRLFLKLVAQIERIGDIEPLPDIDFNIRAGNTLVGFAKLEEVRAAAERESTGQGRMIFEETDALINRIEEEAAIADRAFRKFREMQTEQGMVPEDFSKAKDDLLSRLKKLSDELDRFLASEYGINESIFPNKHKYEDAYEKWRKSHQPFHWFAEFYGILKSGGFDVIIGNPPYVELTAPIGYETKGYKCEEAGNLYALVIERCSAVGRRIGFQGFIVPVSSVSTDRYAVLQQLLLRRQDHFSSYDDRPSRLFDGLEHIRLTIHILGCESDRSSMVSTRYNKWNAEERQTLFQGLRFTSSMPSLVEDTIPKLSSEIEQSILRKMATQRRRMSTFYDITGRHYAYYSRKVGYFLQALNFEPKVLDGKGIKRAPSEFKELTFGNFDFSQLALCCLNTTLFYWFITVFSDCRHVNKREIDAFPIDLDCLVAKPSKKELLRLGKELMVDLRRNSENRIMHFQHDTLTVQCIFPKASKPIIDKIDYVLAQHYGFTDEEIDFIINYDIKYRMGQDEGEEA
jgi:hypothetical protein